MMNFSGLLLAQSNSGDAAGGFMGMMCCCCPWVIALGIVVLAMVGLWKVFSKAGQPGWAAFVPIYNLFVLTQIAGRPAWWVALFLVIAPVAGVIIGIDIAKAFGKSQGFGIGMGLLPFIFYPLLGFSDATYSGPNPMPLGDLGGGGAKPN